MHDVAVLALHGVVPFDLAIPCEVFGRVPGGRYRVRVCGEDADVRASAFTIRAPWTLAQAVTADTVVVPGIDASALPAAEAALDVLRAAAARGARLVSVCSGAFVLAAAGLLDGRRATTHWMAAPFLAERHPAVVVDPEVLFVDDGDVLTSAGAAAGLDLCLHIVRRDHGQAVAAETSRLAVAPLHRDGGQSQFIRHDPPRSSLGLASLLDWLESNLARPLTVNDMARQHNTSTRTLNRCFRSEVGTTPLQWLLDARVRRCRELLETSDLGVSAIARATGFDDPASLRQRFRQRLGVSPTAYRRTFVGLEATPSHPARVRHFHVSGLTPPMTAEAPASRRLPRSRRP